jgi:hypothetical protein
MTQSSHSTNRPSRRRRIDADVATLLIAAICIIVGAVLLWLAISAANARPRCTPAQEFEWRWPTGSRVAVS